MKLYYDKNSKNPTYFMQAGIRNGSKTTTKNVERIGRHSELLAVTPDPLEYARNYIAQVNKQLEEEQLEMNVRVDFSEKLSFTGDTASGSALLNVGYFILQRIYHDLKIKDFFREARKHTKKTFDCNGINRFLTFARILDPRSKLGTFDRLDTYYEQPDFAYQHFIRFLDVLYDNYDGYLEHLFENSGRFVKRNTSVCYFDCTNYYFETEREDDEYTDEVTGEILPGLRRYGRAKQHRPNPLVQMGLFMDGDGIPISMCINPGSDNEQKCAVPLERKISKMFNGRPFIYCADAGLNSIDIRKYNSMGGRSFVVTQSVKKLSAVLQQAVFNDFDYRRLSDNTLLTINRMKAFDRFDADNLPLYNDVLYKVLYADRAVDTGLYEKKTYKNGSSRMVKSQAVLKQRVIVTFSRKTMEYQRRIRNAQIERARKILDTKKPEEIKKGPNDVTRFIRRISTGKDGEKAADRYEIDQSVIDREEKYDGYYAIATNLDDDVKTILQINSRRWKIEDCFRILKTNFNSRPVFHHGFKHITAHFLICYTALLIYRLLEVRLDQYGTHFTTENILQTLRNMNVISTHDAFYTAAFKGSQVCTALNALFGLGLDKKYYRPKDLNKKLRAISR